MSSHIEKPHFYIIIHSSDYTQGPYPEIPQTFVRVCGSLSNSVLLHLPIGAEWQVGLLRLNGGVFLCWGWKQFADFYFLTSGHFLAFRYEGSSRFHVCIFDRTATQIDYPFASSSPHHHSHIEVVDVSSDDEMINPNGESDKYQVAQIDLVTTQETASTSRNNPSTVPNFRDGALEKAKAFQLDHPFFIVTIRPSYVDTNFILCSPLRFFNSHFESKEKMTIPLVSNGRNWPVECCWQKNQISIYHGWKRFARDNSSKVGDMCVFELIKSFTPFFQCYDISQQLRL